MDCVGTFEIRIIYIILCLLCNLLAVLYSCKSVVLTIGKEKSRLESEKICFRVQSYHNQRVILWSLGCVA